MCCGLVGYEECVVFVKLFVKNDEEKLGVQFSGRYICIVIKKQIQLINQNSTIMRAETFQNNLMSLQDNMLNFAYMLTSNRDDAYDLLQDTTLKALDNQDKYAENTNFKGWVFTIMRNIFINNYRKSVRTATVVDTTDNLYHLNISQNSGLDAPEGSYTVNEIQEAIDALADDLRIPISMHVSGYKYQVLTGTKTTHHHQNPALPLRPVQGTPTHPKT